MKTIMQDPELEYELQELYIMSNHWISDIHFVESEVRFFKNVLHKYLAPSLKAEQLTEAELFKKTFELLDADIPVMKNKILELLKFIDPYVNETKNVIGLDLLEKFTALEIEMGTLFQAVKEIKKTLFLFIEAIMKAECIEDGNHL